MYLWEKVKLVWGNYWKLYSFVLIEELKLVYWIEVKE